MSSAHKAFLFLLHKELKHRRKHKSDILKGNLTFVYEIEIRDKPALGTGTPGPKNHCKCGSMQLEALMTNFSNLVKNI